MKNRAAKGRSADGSVETLKDLRLQRRMTQVEVAEVMGVTQASLSKLERRSDVKVSTLKAYVESLGGQLVVSAKFRERAVTIDLPYDPAPPSR
jgi:transcriptional regulator with XRE-family HTH domain